MAARAVAAETGAATRERILRAALEAFSEDGFDGATTREIASRAGVPLGLLQYHFGGKARLWRAAVDRAFAELRAGLEAIVADPRPADVRERIRLLIRGHVAFSARNPEFARLMHEEGKRRGPRMRWLVDRHVRRLFDGVTALLGAADGRGVLRVDLPPVHLHYIIAGSVGLIFHQAAECKRLSGVDPFDEDVVETHARAVEALLLGPPSDAPHPPHQEISR